MTAATLPDHAGSSGRRPNYRRRKLLIETGSVLLGLVILVWTLIPVYNMVFIALDPNGYDQSANVLWPGHATLDAFIGLWTGEVDDVEFFWQQFATAPISGWS